MRGLRADIERAARLDAHVLITGEPGAGKELVAREIHAASSRAGRTFAPVNCAGLPETLLESELFGHVRGSFAGAYRDKPGKLECAHGGTMFLDGVGEMPLETQGLFLRFLETGELRRVGSDRVGGIDVRVIAATDRPLPELVAEGRFRDDLRSRFNAIQLVVPPLRDRPGDIPETIGYFLRRFASTSRSPVKEISLRAIEALTQHAWPGNVRELENLIERIVVVGRHPIIEVEDLPAEIQAGRTRARAVAPAALTAKTSDIVDELYSRLTMNHESFWTAVYPLYMQREITRTDVRDLVQKGLEEARGNYKIMVQLFNMETGDYKKFLNFLRKHQCQLPFKEYRQVSHPGDTRFTAAS